MGRWVVGSPGGHQRELSGPLFTFNGLVISVTTVVAQLTANHSCAKPPHSAGYNSSVQFRCCCITVIQYTAVSLAHSL